MASTAAEVGPRAGATRKVAAKGPPGGSKRWVALGFLLPALVLIGAIVVYPTIDTIVQSFQNDDRTALVGFDNYQEIISRGTTVTAIKNNAIWVAVAPALITGLGLMFAILTERVRFQTAIKVVVFLPMAISFTSVGVLWRASMYDDSVELGFLNAVLSVGTDATGGAGPYPNAQALPDAGVSPPGQGRPATTRDTFEPGEVASIGLVGMTEAEIPPGARQAPRDLSPPEGGLAVVVWRDFKPGGGEPGVIEEDEIGLPGAPVEIVGSSGEVVASGVTGNDGSAAFDTLGGEGPFKARVAASAFERGFTGITWLGGGLITPAIIGAFAWMWAGFAVVVIGAGLSALPRDVLEAARVDGANEWQTFRFVTLPLLAPVLGVVLVTLMINVLKIFDIVLVMAPGSVQDDANVIALDLYKTAFTGLKYGLGSAIAVLLFLLVVPLMALNIRRFKKGQ
jgi:alpha-glucoside transport system permease protein